MTLIQDGIENYAEAHSEPVEPIFQALKEETFAKMSFPQMQVGALEGTFLRTLAKMVNARRVLEIGMFTGYSGLMLASGLPDDGELITCDVDPKAEAMARRYFDKSPHGKKIAIRMGPALETIRTLKGSFDLVFIDADKENYWAYFEASLPLVKTGGLFVVDNTLWSGRVLAPQETSDKAIVAFNDKLFKDPRVEKVLLTVRDGMTLAIKK